MPKSFMRAGFSHVCSCQVSEAVALSMDLIGPGDGQSAIGARGLRPSRSHHRRHNRGLTFHMVNHCISRIQVATGLMSTLRIRGDGLFPGARDRSNLLPLRFTWPMQRHGISAIFA